MGKNVSRKIKRRGIEINLYYNLPIILGKCKRIMRKLKKRILPYKAGVKKMHEKKKIKLQTSKTL